MLPFISHKFQRQNVERAKLALLTDKLDGSSDSNESDRQSEPTKKIAIKVSMHNKAPRGPGA